VRTRLHWRVSLFRKHRSLAIETLTQNLSSEGFYCRSEMAFTPGERLMCTLAVPIQNRRGKEEERRLECEVRVIRVDSSGEAYGIAFQIENYRVMVPAASGER